MEENKRVTFTLEQVRQSNWLERTLASTGTLASTETLASTGTMDPAERHRLSARWVALATAHPGENNTSCLLLKVPGRIEVLGKHTDYAGGPSLTCASSKSMVSIVSSHPKPSLVLVDAARTITLEIPYHQVGQVEGASWATYANTVLSRLMRHFGTPSNGVTIVLESDIPSAAGLSSSSGLIITLALGLLAAGHFPHPIPAFSRAEFAGFAGAIESGAQYGDWEGDAGVGTRGGSQDHTAILCSSAGHLGLYSYFPVKKELSVVFPASLSFVIASSGVKARKTGDAKDAYNLASDRAKRVVVCWNENQGTRFSNMGEMVRSQNFSRSLLQSILFTEENAASLWNRSLQFEKETGDIIPGFIRDLNSQNWSGLGGFTDESQRMADGWLGNQVPETNELVHLARQAGAYAASAFGAGFGGAVWALIDRENADTFRARWMKQYAAAFPSKSQYLDFFIDHPSDGVAIFGDTTFQLK